jgi:hypothetical protein
MAVPARVAACFYVRLKNPLLGSCREEMRKSSVFHEGSLKRDVCAKEKES